MKNILNIIKMVIIKCHLLISELLAATIKKRNPINIKYFFFFGIIPSFFFIFTQNFYIERKRH